MNLSFRNLLLKNLLLTTILVLLTFFTVSGSAFAQRVEGTSFNGNQGPFTDCPGFGGDCGQHWNGSGKQGAKLLVSGLKAGQKVVINNINGSINFGGARGVPNPLSCRDGDHSGNAAIPKLIAVAQFTNDNNQVINPGGTPSNRGAHYLRSFEGGIVVPVGATRLWGSFPDSRYNDNKGTCSFSVNVQSTQCKDGVDNDGDGKIDMDDPGCANPDDNDESNPNGKPTISKVGPTEVRPGGEALYEVTVRNPTNQFMPEVGMGEQILAPYQNLLTFLPAKSSPGCIQEMWQGTPVYNCPAFSLQPYESKVFRFTFKYPANAPCGAVVMDQADVGLPGVGSVDWAKFMTTVKCDPITQCKDGIDNDGDGWIDLDDSCCKSSQDDNEGSCNTPGKPTITKVGPTEVRPGGEALYQVTVKNPTNQVMPQVGVGEQILTPYQNLLIYLPEKSTPGCVQQGNAGAPVYNCAPFSLQPHESKVFNFTFKFPANAPCGAVIMDQADVGLTNGSVDWAKFMTTVKCDPVTQCKDGIDNDGDGWIDLDDSCCKSPTDNNEGYCNTPGKPTISKTGPAEVKPGDVAIYTVTVKNPTNQLMPVVGTGEQILTPYENLLIYLPEQSTPGCNKIDFNGFPAYSCATFQLQPHESKVFKFAFKYPLTAPCGADVMDQADVALETGSVDWAKFITKVKCKLPQCSDGIDNDGDGWIDLDDSGCDGPNDDDETNKPQCKDGKDNDGDGKIDFPKDPGCDSPEDNDEKDKPQCSDGKDNDGDGWIDLDDSGCDGPNDDDETNKPQCKDGKDNDGDGKIDFPKDPGCDSPEDNDETDKPQCSDGKDNDGDGKIDHPQDPGCDSPDDNDEWNTTTSPVLPTLDCVYKLANGKYRAFFGYENTGAQAVTIQAGTQTNGQMNFFTPGEANRGQPSQFEVGAKSAVFAVDFDGQALTWKVQPTGGDLKTVTASTSSKYCKPVKPIAECRDKKNNKFTTYFGYQNNNSFKIKLNIPSENSFQPAPEDRGQQDDFLPGRVVNAFSVNSDGDLTWKLGNELAAANTNLPRCTANDGPTCGSGGNYSVACGGTETRIPLTSTASDPDGDTLTYKWSTDCAKAKFSNPNIANPDLILDTSDGAARNCGLWLEVSDGTSTAQTCDGSVKVSACNNDCKGTPNGSSKMDQCGVCGGNNECIDCKGVPNGGARVDQCGVCGGNNSCVDCAGTPNGSAKPDQCGVCNGNGKTCQQCTNTDITDKKLAVDIALNEQRGLVLRLTNRLQNVSNNNPKFNKLIVDSRKQSEALYLQGWRDIWTGIPNVSVNCSNSTTCTENDLSVSINAVSTSNTDLHGIAQNLLRQINGQRNKKDKQAAQNDKKLDQQSDSLYSSSQAVLQSIPRFNSVCK